MGNRLPIRVIKLASTKKPGPASKKNWPDKLKKDPTTCTVQRYNSDIRNPLGLACQTPKSAQLVMGKDHDMFAILFHESFKPYSIAGVIAEKNGFLAIDDNGVYDTVCYPLQKDGEAHTSFSAPSEPNKPRLVIKSDSVFFELGTDALEFSHINANTITEDWTRFVFNVSDNGSNPKETMQTVELILRARRFETLGFFKLAEDGVMEVYLYPNKTIEHFKLLYSQFVRRIA